MNARREHKKKVHGSRFTVHSWPKALLWLWISIAASPLCWGQDVRSLVKTGNQQYGAGEFSEALNQYEQALTENPQAYEARFNQANAYYRLDDLSEAVTAFRKVAAESKDMDLVAKAKYNLGNTIYQQGIKQQDSNLQKAMETLLDSIKQWRSVLELEPEHAQAARNIAVTRLKIKDILDKIKQQQEQQDPNQPQDPNQTQQQNQQQDQNQQQQQNDQAGQDPNQPQEQPQQPPQDPNEGQDPNEAQNQPQPEEQESQEPQQDMTAQAILDREQRQKDQRQQNRRVQRRPVLKDW